MDQKIPGILIHSAGAAEPGGPGGYGATVEAPGHEIVTLYGRSPQTSTQNMSLTGIILGLQAAARMENTQEMEVQAVTNSLYIQNSISNGRPERWMREGRLEPNGRNDARKTLWKQFLEAAHDRQIHCRHAPPGETDPRQTYCRGTAGLEAWKQARREEQGPA